MYTASLSEVVTAAVWNRHLGTSEFDTGT